jgi:sigma-E factor negative regulatory protein RseC
LPYVLGALVFFLLDLVVVKRFDRRAAKNQALKPVIVEILDKHQS